MNVTTEYDTMNGTTDVTTTNDRRDDTGTCSVAIVRTTRSFTRVHDRLLWRTKAIGSREPAGITS